MSSDEYATAEESSDAEEECTIEGFYIWTSSDGTKWYLPNYYRADADLEVWSHKTIVYEFARE
jgi:hypothetical protein